MMRRNGVALWLAAALGAVAFPAGAAQDRFTETRFHRVHLRNGNFVDGALVRQDVRGVVLKLKVGEMTIRQDQIDHVELVKLRSIADKPEITKPVKPPIGVIDRPPVTPDPTATKSTPEAVRKRVDEMLRVLKLSKNDNDTLSVDELSGLGEEAAAYLAARLPDLEAKLQMHAASALGALKSPKATGILEQHLKHSAPLVRAYASQALASMGEQEKLRYLPKMLQDPDAGVRRNTIGMLGGVEDRDWYTPVSDLIMDRDDEVRRQALHISRQLAARHGMDEEYMNLLVGNLGRASGTVRADVIAGISGLGKQDAWKSIAPYLRDSDSGVRAAAALGIMNLGPTDAAGDIVDALVLERDRLARVYLAGAAQKLKAAKAVEPLVEWMNDPDQDIRRIASLALQTITGQNFGLDAGKWAEWLRSREK